MHDTHDTQDFDAANRLLCGASDLPGEFDAPRGSCGKPARTKRPRQQEKRADDDGPRKSQATLLAELATVSDLWHSSGQGVAYATIPVNGHRETWPIRSAGFKRWLARLYFDRCRSAPGAQAVADALAVLEGQSTFGGPEHPVFIRVAGHDGRLYLDLCNSTWQAVEIDATGWRIIEAADCPVRYRRAKGMLPLPTPVSGGSIDELREFVNVATEDWPLLLGWLVAAFRPSGPYPILALHGEQGSAKSTTARTLRALIDPNVAPVRCEPREPRDLMIAANNGWLVAQDNLSHVPGWLSDALCRLATGGGFATRTLYENDEETIFDAMRPSILTGIEELATRGDLLDRCLILQLPRISEDRRRPESDFWREFGAAHGRLLGAVLDAVSVAIRKLPATRIDRLPRMADFALWATAAESGLGLQPDEFLAAYRGNRESVNEVALESSPIAKHVQSLAEAGGFSGTPGDLLVQITGMATEAEKRGSNWPKNARSLSGHLKRLAPNLRAAAVEIEFARGTDRKRTRTVTITRKVAEFASACVRTVREAENPSISAADLRTQIKNTDEKVPVADANCRSEFGENPRNCGLRTQTDGADARILPHSERVQVTL